MRVDLICTGLGHVRRGYESFAQECFDAVRPLPSIDMRLLKGGGLTTEREIVVPCLKRSSVLGKALGRALKRSSYHVEQLTFLRAYLAGSYRIRRPELIFTSDANLANHLSRWRSRTGAKISILFSNGGPVTPPFPEYDHVQQVALPYYEQALMMGEPASRHSLVPYGVGTVDLIDGQQAARRLAARERLKLPREVPIILSVGNVSAGHKRMDHVVREVAALKGMSSQPFLLLVGQQDSATPEIQALSESLLGGNCYRITTCAPEEIVDYYQAADIFVLASLKEGFGRVLIEASYQGLPCVVDDNSVMRYVLGDTGLFIPMNETGALTTQLHSILDDGQWTGEVRAATRRQYAIDRFSWQKLAPAYVEMFLRAANCGYPQGGEA